MSLFSTEADDDDKDTFSSRRLSGEQSFFEVNAKRR